MPARKRMIPYTGTMINRYGNTGRNEWWQQHRTLIHDVTNIQGLTPFVPVQENRHIYFVCKDSYLYYMYLFRDVSSVHLKTRHCTLKHVPPSISKHIFYLRSTFVLKPFNLKVFFYLFQVLPRNCWKTYQ